MTCEHKNKNESTFHHRREALWSKQIRFCLWCKLFQSIEIICTTAVGMWHPIRRADQMIVVHSVIACLNVYYNLWLSFWFCMYSPHSSIYIDLHWKRRWPLLVGFHYSDFFESFVMQKLVLTGFRESWMCPSTPVLARSLHYPAVCALCRAAWIKRLLLLFSQIFCPLFLLSNACATVRMRSHWQPEMESLYVNIVGQ